MLLVRISISTNRNLLYIPELFRIFQIFVRYINVCLCFMGKILIMLLPSARKWTYRCIAASRSIGELAIESTESDYFIDLPA